MPKTRLFMPLLHKKVTTFDGPAWYFSEGMYLETILDEDYSALQRDKLEDHHKTYVNIRTTCLYIDDPIFDDLQEYAKRVAIQIKYVLNNFTINTPTVLPYAALVVVGARSRIKEVIDLEAITNVHSYTQQIFKLRSSAQPHTISTFYNIVDKCCRDHRSLQFTLARFNSGFTRQDIYDRIVDITISLESLISGSSEVSFKFALYNAFTAETDAKARKTAFELLQALYSARSGIVHGDIASRDKVKVLERIQTNWPQIIQTARAALNYHLIFVNEKGLANWDQHLKDLVFGIDERIVN